MLYRRWLTALGVWAMWVYLGHKQNHFLNAHSKGW